MGLTSFYDEYYKQFVPTELVYEMIKLYKRIKRTPLGVPYNNRLKIEVPPGRPVI